jgi:hypothetical protein
MKNIKVEKNRVVYHNSKTDEFLQGSSLYKNVVGVNTSGLNVGGKMVSKKDDAKVKQEIKDKGEIECLEVLGAERTAELYYPNKRAPKTGEYKLNKQKVRGKICAFFGLKQSKKFTAFYSVSFPKDMKQEEAVKAFNTWRTRLSKLGLKTFIRVCEFQVQTGTIHFHMLTNNFMNIRTVNYMMAKILDNMGILKRNNLSLMQYNGVDVKLVRNSKALGAYITKYVSKNKDTFEVLPYHCSRDISALFYCFTVPTSTKNIDYKVTAQDIENALKLCTTLVIESEYASIEYFGKTSDGKHMSCPERLFKFMYEENQHIYDLFAKYGKVIAIGIQDNTLN